MTTVEEIRQIADSKYFATRRWLLIKAAEEIEALTKERDDLRRQIDRDRKSVSWADETRILLAKELGVIAKADRVVSAVQDLRRQNAELQEKNKAWALGVEQSNTDIVDMQRDEFRRIMAITDNPEIKGLCERAIATIEQTVPVVVQRDALANQNAELRECLKVKDEALRVYMSGHHPEWWLSNWPLEVATKALAAQPEEAK